MLLKTMTTQKVACPTTTVNRPKPMPIGSRTVRKAALRAMPLTMPGSAIGRTSRKDTVRRPKKRWRWTAYAARVPSTRAIAVAASPALSEVSRAWRAPSLCRAARHQRPVRPLGGQPKERSVLTELSSTSSSGT
ncbi:hypothetical protein SANTM175S_09047 [Streptomyces antimycoticus]